MHYMTLYHSILDINLLMIILVATYSIVILVYEETLMASLPCMYVALPQACIIQCMHAAKIDIRLKGISKISETLLLAPLPPSHILLCFILRKTLLCGSPL